MLRDDDESKPEYETDPAAKPLKGFGGRSVLEIVTGHRRGDGARGLPGNRHSYANLGLGEARPARNTPGLSPPKPHQA